MNIYEIANKAGVSIATVSRVINNNPNVKWETRIKVEKVLQEFKYTPNAIARSLAVNNTRTIGVLTSDVRDSYYANAIYIIEQEFRKYGYNVILCNTGGELEKKIKYLQVLLEKKVDGIILVGSVFKEKSDNGHILEVAEKVPVVMLNSNLIGPNVYCVVGDDYKASTEIVKTFYKKGHRDIVFIYDVDSFSGLAKIDGYKQGMMDMGLSIDEAGIIRTDSGLTGGYKAVESLEKSNVSYTAIITSEDILAAGALKKLREIGKKVPEEISVFGFNNSLISQCTEPELSTVDNKVEEMSINTVKVLYAVLKGSQVDQKTVVAPKLIFRGTTV